jgi:hypothetical protein
MSSYALILAELSDEQKAGSRNISKVSIFILISNKAILSVRIKNLIFSRVTRDY